MNNSHNITSFVRLEAEKTTNCTAPHLNSKSGMERAPRSQFEDVAGVGGGRSGAGAISHTPTPATVLSLYKWLGAPTRTLTFTHGKGTPAV